MGIHGGEAESVEKKQDFFRNLIAIFRFYFIFRACFLF